MQRSNSHILPSLLGRGCRALAVFRKTTSPCDEAVASARADMAAVRQDDGTLVLSHGAAHARVHGADHSQQHAIYGQSHQKPLRIIQAISPSKIAGAERSTIALCKGLMERGHAVRLIIKKDHPMIEVARKEGIDVVSLGIGGKLNLLSPLRIAREIRRFKADIVGAQLSTASLWGSIAARLRGIPCVVTVRALNTKSCYVFAHQIIAVSQAVKEHLTSQGLPAERIRVVYNGIDLTKLAPVENIQDAKEKIGLPRTSPVIGVTAHLTKKKGHAWFLHAAQTVTREFPDTRFLLVGDGVEKAALQALACELGIEENVVFAGFHSDVAPWMAAMDFLVLPSIAKEGFGRVLVEAAAMEKPAIASNVGGIAEVVEDKSTGLIVQAGEVEQLSEAMLLLLRDEKLRHNMGRAGRLRALQKFPVQRMVEEVEGVYLDVLRERRSPRERTAH